VVDFYIPENELAFQVSYFLRDEVTRKRESEALTMMSKRLPCRRRLILTYDEEEVISDKFGSIEVLLVWKWLLM
jgi:predicted AAA+ superfamily ATPase